MPFAELVIFLAAELASLKQSSLQKIANSANAFLSYEGIYNVNNS